MADVLDKIRARREAAPTIPLEIPEWDMKCFIRPLSAGKFMSIMKQGNKAEVAAQTIIHGLVDKDGKQIFEDNAESLAVLVGESHVVIDRVSAAIIRAEIDLDEAKNS